MEMAFYRAAALHRAAALLKRAPNLRGSRLATAIALLGKSIRGDKERGTEAIHDGIQKMKISNADPHPTSEHAARNVNRIQLAPRFSHLLLS
jgi:hypothetical protein